MMRFFTSRPTLSLSLFFCDLVIVIVISPRRTRP
jgi:hypothetical protein